MNPLLLLALILLMAGMLLRMVGWILMGVARGIWGGSRLMATGAGRLFVRRERAEPLAGIVVSAR